MQPWLPLTLGGTLVVSTLAGSSALAGRGPGVPGPAIERQRILDEDPRLEGSVTIRARRSPLAAVVADLGRRVGLTMTADPEVANEPVIVSAREQPAKEVMRHLARLFNYRWMRKGRSEPYRYELYQDLRSKQEEQALRRGPRLRALDALREALRHRLELAQAPPAQLVEEATAQDAVVARLEQTAARAATASGPLEGNGLQERGAWNYRLREMADPFRRALTALVPTVTSLQWAALLDGRTLVMSTRREPGTVPLPPVAAQALRRAQPTSLPPGARFRFATPEDESDCRQAERQSQEAWRQAEAIQVSVRLQSSCRPGSAEAILSVTPSARMPNASTSPSVPPIIVVGRWQADALADAGEFSSADPDLQVKHRLPGSAGSPRSDATATSEGGLPSDGADPLNRLLPDIAETWAINLVADAYEDTETVFPEPYEGKEWSLAELVRRYVLPNARWTREGAFFHVRRHAWYELRQRR